MKDETKKLLQWHDRRQKALNGFPLHPTDLADTLTDTPIEKVPVRLWAAYRAFKKRARAARLSLTWSYRDWS